MKKLLVLLVSAAVAVSASAGVNLKEAKKSMAFKAPKTLKMEKKSTKFVKALNFTVEPSERMDMAKGALTGNRATSDLITEQPEGTLKTYTRDGLCLYRGNSGYSLAYQSGEVNIVYAPDGQTVYIQDIMSTLDYGTWVVGYKDGNKITVPLGQFISFSDEYGYGRILAWGSWVNDGSTGYINDDSVTECTFTVNGGNITMDNTTFDWDTYNFTGLSVIWDDDLTFAYFMDMVTVWTGDDEAIYPNVENLKAVPDVHTADVTWDDANCTSWNLRYREYRPGANYFWDFESSDSWGEWSSYDGDEDGFDWFPAELEEEGICPSGVGAFVSYCYNPDDGSALTPEDYLISPDVILHGEASFYAWGGEEDYCDDHFIAYVLTEEGLFQLGEETQVTATPAKYSFSLSDYEGVEGCLVICHTGCTDQAALLIDDVFIGDPNSNVYEDTWHYVYDLTETKYTIEGLNPATTYEVQVVGLTEDGHSYWSDSEIFTTLTEAPAVPDVYMLGGNAQPWDPTNGTKFDYNAEDNIYTKTVTFPDENNFFGFTTALAENNDDGGWAYIEQYRFGAVADGDNFIYYDSYNGQALSLTWDEYKSFCIAAGEYNLTVDLTSMKLIIEKVVPAHNYDKGDVNHDHAVNIADVTVLIDYLLGTGTVCEICADVNGDTAINIADVTSLIDVLLAGE